MVRSVPDSEKQNNYHINKQKRICFIIDAPHAYPGYPGHKSLIKILDLPFEIDRLSKHSGPRRLVLEKKSLESKFTKNHMQHMRRHAKRWIGSTFEGHPETAIVGVTSQLPAAANQKSAAASAITCQQAWSELTVSTEDSNTQCRWLPSNFTCIWWQTVNKQARNQVSLLVDKHRMWEDQALTYAQIAFSKSSLETALPHRCATSWPEDSTKFYVCSALPYNLFEVQTMRTSARNNNQTTWTQRK